MNEKVYKNGEFLSFPQPIGTWKRRKAMDCFIQIATGNVVTKWPDELMNDDEGFNIWHYWANGQSPEKLWYDARIFLGDKYDLHCANNGEHPLHRLLLQKKIDAGKLWIEDAKWPVSAKKDYDTFWHCLAWSGCIDTFKSFYECLSVKDINEKDEQGLTPAIIAFHRGGMEFLNYWLFLGANPDVCDNQNRSLLHHVAMYGDVSSYSEVLDLGANEDIKNNKGQSPKSILTEKNKHLNKNEIESMKAYWLKQYIQKNIF